MASNDSRNTRNRHGTIQMCIDFTLLLIRESLKWSHCCVVLLVFNFIAIFDTFFVFAYFLHFFYTVASIFVYYRVGNMQNVFYTCGLLSLGTWCLWNFWWSAALCFGRIAGFLCWHYVIFDVNFSTVRGSNFTLVEWYAKYIFSRTVLDGTERCNLGSIVSSLKARFLVRLIC